MERVAILIRLIADGGSLDEVWRKAGFGSPEEARCALRNAADGIEMTPPALSLGAEETNAVRTDPAVRVDDLIIYTDGASRGNPGPSAIAAVAYSGSGERLTAVTRRIGEATNNVAEYRAVLEGLRLAGTLRAARVTVRLDSELVVRQLTGRYRVKSGGLRPLAEAVLAEASCFARCTFEHVPREENREADRLAVGALNETGTPNRAES